MRPRERWLGRALTLEAMALLVIARSLIAFVPFARWRGMLGEQTKPEGGDPCVRLDANRPARQLARAVERASARVPGSSLCLPRAMALQWMMRRRRLSGELLIGVRSGVERGQLDDLHAWVVCRGEVVLGATGIRHRPIYAAKAVEDGSRKT